MFELLFGAWVWVVIFLMIFGPALFVAWLAKINNRSPYRWFFVSLLGIGWLIAIIIITSLPPGNRPKKEKKRISISGYGDTPWI